MSGSGIASVRSVSLRRDFPTVPFVLQEELSVASDST
jgi:hypothetical protein